MVRYSGAADGSPPTTLGASSPVFSEAVRPLANVLASERTAKGMPPGTALVLALPPHEDNSRRIPMPEFQVAAGRVPADAGRGQVVIRADFGEDRQLQGMDVLYASMGGISDDLARQLERSISLRPINEERHRVVVFALLTIGDKVRLQAAVPFLPKCCCSPGGEVCV